MEEEKNQIKKAVALKYERGKDAAPKVTAKGTGLIAEKILEIAEKEGIPVTEDPDLVTALARLDFYDQIPPELYRAVAEILAFAYSINNKMKASR
ncbi:MAG: EscU/YscU/HrcU family type III secretion system export apparatus switch protein [Deltaproteobacteria bacterium]|nr:EscU/YscU/HrcU family type III secretion system export apparatus switch protein [Deltaproteobacteria bacterium]